jgi:hypothetical protein
MEPCRVTDAPRRKRVPRAEREQQILRQSAVLLADAFWPGFAAVAGAGADEGGETDVTA